MNGAADRATGGGIERHDVVDELLLLARDAGHAPSALNDNAETRRILREAAHEIQRLRHAMGVAGRDVAVRLSNRARFGHPRA